MRGVLRREGKIRAIMGVKEEADSHSRPRTERYRRLTAPFYVGETRPQSAGVQRGGWEHRLCIQ